MSILWVASPLLLTGFASVVAGNGMAKSNKSGMVERNRSCVSVANHETRRGMVLPFQPLSLAFNHVNYYVDMPAVSHFP